VTEKQRKHIRLFYSYARKDKTMRDRLAGHFGALQRSGQVQPWHDDQIPPGTEWKYEIEIQLATADVILLLVSPEFLSSKSCYTELQQALKRHERREAAVIPVILRPVDWQTTQLGRLQALPANGKPVVLWNNRDEAYLNVVEGVRKIVALLLDRQQTPQPTQYVCRTCGHTVSPEERICFGCGALLNSCPSCGFRNRIKGHFCLKCGNRLVIVRTTRKFCPHCQASNPPDAVYCDACGGFMKEGE
jgi:hypothetical protein